VGCWIGEVGARWRVLRVLPCGGCRRMGCWKNGHVWERQSWEGRDSHTSYSVVKSVPTASL
jgi:hypothetical protein